MNKSCQLTGDQSDLVQAQILPGELVRWTGCEPRCRVLKNGLLRLIIYTLWTAAMGFLAGTMILMNPTFLRNSVRGALPVLAPICLTALGGFLLIKECIAIKRYRPDLYAITTRRALVISACQAQQVWSYGPDKLKLAQVRRRKDGTGDILFEHSRHWSTDAEGRTTSQANIIGFWGLDCVDEVAGMLDQIGQPGLGILDGR